MSAKWVKCLCKFCGEKIEFDEAKIEDRKILIYCPHCGQLTPVSAPPPSIKEYRKKRDFKFLAVGLTGAFFVIALMITAELMLPVTFPPNAYETGHRIGYEQVSKLMGLSQADTALAYKRAEQKFTNETDRAELKRGYIDGFKSGRIAAKWAVDAVEKSYNKYYDEDGDPRMP